MVRSAAVLLSRRLQRRRDGSALHAYPRPLFGDHDLILYEENGRGLPTVPVFNLLAIGCAGKGGGGGPSPGGGELRPPARDRDGLATESQVRPTMYVPTVDRNFVRHGQ